MYASASDRVARGHSRGRLSAWIVVGVIALGIMGYQATDGAETSDVPPVRPVATRPAGIEPQAPADRIERELALRDAALGARYAGMPADRIEDQLERDRDATRGFRAGCVSYRLDAHVDGGWHVICVELAE